MWRLVTMYYTIVGFIFLSARLWYHVVICLWLILFNTVSLHYKYRLYMVQHLAAPAQRFCFNLQCFPIPAKENPRNYYYYCGRKFTSLLVPNLQCNVDWFHKSNRSEDKHIQLSILHYII